MTRVAIISDTHIPDRERAIPGAFRDRIGEAEHVIHAGDFRSLAVLSQVQGLADGNLTAVYGNGDPRAIDLPEVDTLSVGGVTFVVTHGHRRRRNRTGHVAEVVRERAGGGAIGVFGHTHRPEDTRVDGVRLLNPGSATGAPPAPNPTMMTAEVNGGGVDVTVHEA